MNSSYLNIRQQVERRYRRFSFLAFHIIVAMTAGMLWLTGTESGVGARVFAVLWGGVLVCHALKVYLDDAHDRTIERTWDHYSGERDLTTLEEKPKRSLWLDTDEFDTPDEAARPEIDLERLPLWTRSKLDTLALPVVKVDHRA